MSKQISILGLGQIGASVGLGLKEQKQLVRLGHDRELVVMQEAQKLNAVDSIKLNLHEAVEGADLVLLALPADQIIPTLQLILPDLKAGCVVLDTSPIKEPRSAWLKEHFPAGRFYVGLTPVIGPRYLMSDEFGIAAARADLFHDSLLGIVSLPGLTGAAIGTASDLADLLKAEHLFIEATESDSLMAAVHLLPQVMASALLNLTVNRPGWLEGRKLAGRPYALVSAPSGTSDTSQGLTHAALDGGPHLLRLLDELQGELAFLRQAIADQDAEKLQSYFSKSSIAGAEWWADRSLGNWAEREKRPDQEIPSAAEWMNRIFFGRLGVRRLLNETKKQNEDKKR